MDVPGEEGLFFGSATDDMSMFIRFSASVSPLRLYNHVSQHAAIRYLCNPLVSSECNALLSACAQYVMDRAQATTAGGVQGFPFLDYELLSE